MARKPQDFDGKRLEGFAANIYRVILVRSLKGFMRKRLRVIYHKQLRFLGLRKIFFILFPAVFFVFYACIITPKDEEGPVVIGSTPANGEKNVFIYTPIVVHFNENIFLKRDITSDKAITGNFSFEIQGIGNDSIKIVPYGSSLFMEKYLIPDREYTINFTDLVVDEHGNGMEETEFSFNTVFCHYGKDTISKGEIIYGLLMFNNKVNTHVIDVVAPDTVGVILKLKKTWEMELTEYVSIGFQAYSGFEEVAGLSMLDINKAERPETLVVPLDIGNVYSIRVELIKTQPTELFYEMRIF